MADIATTPTNPLLQATGTLTGIFKDVSDAYFGFQSRQNALEQLDNETNKNPTAYTAADKATQASPLLTGKNIAIGAGILLVAGIVIARLLK